MLKHESKQRLHRVGAEALEDLEAHLKQSLVEKMAALPVAGNDTLAIAHAVMEQLRGVEYVFGELNAIFQEQAERIERADRARAGFKPGQRSEL